MFDVLRALFGATKAKVAQTPDEDPRGSDAVERPYRDVLKGGDQCPHCGADDHGTDLQRLAPAPEGDGYYDYGCLACGFVWDADGVDFRDVE